MTYPNKVYQVALSKAKYIGPHNAKLLLEKVGDVQTLFENKDLLKVAFPKVQERILKELYRPSLLSEAEKIVTWCEQNATRIYFIGDDDYPARLKECPDAPIVLYAKGNYDKWSQDFALSVVGTRNISYYGQQMTERIIGDLSEIFPQALITSGLAYGVDITAHRQALAKGMPTVAVLAHGLDKIYPARHSRDAEAIMQNGAIISEYPPFTNPERYYFVGRNRIIAGLSDATFVVEAGAKSGSLSTANLALDYDREVLALPGRVGDRYSEGCNHLISTMKGALVTSAEDIVRLMGWERKENALVQELTFEEEEAPLDNPLLQLIKEEQPIHINDLARRLGEDMLSLSNQLFELELDGLIQAMAGGLYALSR